MPGPRITAGERVTLRTLENEDLPFLQQAYTNPELRYPLGTPLKNQDQLETWTEDEDTDQFLVCLDGDGEASETCNDGGEIDTRPIGAVFVEDASWRRPELVYWLLPDVQGNGYGKEAVSLVIDYVFRVYDTPAVSAGAYAFNDASRGLLESLGFEKEGRLRKERFIDGRYVDTVQYGLLREEWRERTEGTP